MGVKTGLVGVLRSTGWAVPRASVVATGHGVYAKGRSRLVVNEACDMGCGVEHGGRKCLGLLGSGRPRKGNARKVACVRKGKMVLGG